MNRWLNFLSATLFAVVTAAANGVETAAETAAETTTEITTETAPALGPFSVDYTFSNSGINLVQMTRTLRHDGDGRYTLKSESRAMNVLALFDDGKITETSTWHFVDGTPSPLHYEYLRTGRKDRHVELTFDWQQGVVTNTINNDPWTMKIPPQTQDKLLYQLTLMLDLKADRTPLVYRIADGGKMKVMNFRNLGEETISLPVGKLNTVKLFTQTSKRSTTVWCAREYDYLPVRIEHVGKDGRTVVMEATRIKGLPWPDSRSQTSDVR